MAWSPYQGLSAGLMRQAWVCVGFSDNIAAGIEAVCTSFACPALLRQCTDRLVLIRCRETASA